LKIPESTDWDIVGSHTGSFTIDLWVKHDDHVGQETYLSQSPAGDSLWRFRNHHGTGLSFQVIDGGSTVVNVAGGEIADTDWHHVALVKEGKVSTSKWTIYRDGVSVATGTDDSTWSMNSGDRWLGIGGNTNGGDYYAGYMDEIRYSKGIARWTGNFVPPNVPYAAVDNDFVTSVRQLSHGWKGSEGGEIHRRSDKVIHAFKSSGTFHIPRPITCDIVVVGAGAAGSVDHGGGGGAGAIGYKTSYSLAAGRYAVTVGAGGVSSTGNHITGAQGGTSTRMFTLSAKGGTSSFSNLIVAYGGQGGQGCCGTATLGGGTFGCGGGALRCNSVTTTDKGTTTISATFAAYMSTAGTDADYGGGGGGAGAVGANSSAGTGGNGARPVTWADAWGTDTNNDPGGGYFAGGGAGGSHNNNSVTDDVHGGYGGGGGYGDDGFGNLEDSNQYAGPCGLANTGGGGAGVGNPYPSSATSGAGGSGIVLIKYDT
jgi:hypothetical protein